MNPESANIRDMTLSRPRRISAEAIRRIVHEWIYTVNDAIDVVRYPWEDHEYLTGRKVVIKDSRPEVVSALRTCYARRGWTVYAYRVGERSGGPIEHYLEFWPRQRVAKKATRK